MSSKQAGECVAGGKPPCPICPKVQECPHGLKVVGKSQETTRTLAIKSKMTPSEAGGHLSRLALLKRIGKRIGE